MAVLNGKGATITRGGITMKLKKISVPGWSMDMIDVTGLDNAEWKTKVEAGLREVEDMTVTAEYDPTGTYTSAAMALEANASTVITFPDSAGTLTFWAVITGFGSVDLETGSEPTQDITLGITNRNGSGVETGPVYAAAST